MWSNEFILAGVAGMDRIGQSAGLPGLKKVEEKDAAVLEMLFLKLGWLLSEFRILCHVQRATLDVHILWLCTSRNEWLAVNNRSISEYANE